MTAFELIQGIKLSTQGQGWNNLREGKAKFGPEVLVTYSEDLLSHVL